jgi:ADP-ribose pyrophosphatase YjhB (NUDIX family)
LASWAGRWTLGAAGSVDAGENPADTLARELAEEWSVAPERLQCEALVELPQRLIMFIGQAWLAPGAEVVPDAEHDAYEWWPREIDSWPDHAEDPVRLLARMLAT